MGGFQVKNLETPTWSNCQEVGGFLVLTWKPPGGFPDFDLETPRGVSWGVSLWTTLPVHTVSVFRTYKILSYFFHSFSLCFWFDALCMFLKHFASIFFLFPIPGFYSGHRFPWYFKSNFTFSFFFAFFLGACHLCSFVPSFSYIQNPFNFFHPFISQFFFLKIELVFILPFYLQIKLSKLFHHFL